jgi:hypothetical protein
MVSDQQAGHRRAADRHEAAADNHERAARFWEGQGDSKRAGIQHELAEYERRGAELEYRWADLIDPDPAHSEIRTADLITGHTRQTAETASGILTQLANTLKRTAELAEEHAERRERAGQTGDAAKEHQAAQRARDAAQRARSQADQWLRLLGEREA